MSVFHASVLLLTMNFVITLSNSLRIHSAIASWFHSYFDNGRFYARDVKVVNTHLTSETLKPSGIKTGRIKVDELTEKKKKQTFSEKDWVLSSEDTGDEETRRQINLKRASIRTK